MSARRHLRRPYLLPLVALGLAGTLSTACATGSPAPPAPSRPIAPATAPRPAPASTPAAKATPPPPPPPPTPAQQSARKAARESYLVAPGDLSAAVLRAMVGIVTLSVGVDAQGSEAALPTYTLQADVFTPAADLQLAGTRPVSGFELGADAVIDGSRAVARRYPGLASRGLYVEVALDPGGLRTAWLRRTPEGSFPNSVAFADFADAGSLRCYQVDLDWLGRDTPRKLFDKPDAGAAFRPISNRPGAPGFVGLDLVPQQRKGNFIEIAALRGLDNQRESLGWVELKDSQGRLTLWFTPGPDC